MTWQPSNGVARDHKRGYSKKELEIKLEVCGFAIDRMLFWNALNSPDCDRKRARSQASVRILLS